MSLFAFVNTLAANFLAADGPVPNDGVGSVSLHPIFPPIGELIAAQLPVFGICLGHQLLGLASGARTVKMKFGHHGANHPVQDLQTGRVLITSQNHGFAIDEASLPANLKATHRSLFDGSLQGVARTDCDAFGFQGHPEASPGPHDVKYLFERFTAAMQRRRAA
jgi:carbamoyl-phosphate synthase small subunit